MRKLELHWQILIAIIIAAVIGGYVHNAQAGSGIDPTIFGIRYVAIFEYVGTMFLNALKMIIVPLITSSIIVGVAGIGSGGNLGALGGKTLLFYAGTTLAAILVGLIIINAIGPGYVDGEPAKDLLALEASTAELEERVAGKGPGDVAKIFLRMVPPNIFKAAVEGQMLGIIFFSILFGYFMTHLDNEAALCSVIGHEIGHVTARHSVSQISKAQLAQLGLGLGSVVAPEQMERFGGLAVMGMEMLFLKYSRDDERQADDLGLRYLVRGEYDPQPMPEVFDMLGRVSEAAGQGRVISFPALVGAFDDPID